MGLDVIVWRRRAMRLNGWLMDPLRLVHTLTFDLFGTILDLGGGCAMAPGDAEHVRG